VRVVQRQQGDQAEDADDLHLRFADAFRQAVRSGLNGEIERAETQDHHSQADGHGDQDDIGLARTDDKERQMLDTSAGVDRTLAL
jgi:hypothetical protein